MSEREHITIRCLNCEDNHRKVKMAENAVNLEMVESLKRAKEIHRLLGDLYAAKAKISAIEMEVKYISDIRYSQSRAIRHLQDEIRKLRIGTATRPTSYRGNFHTLRFRFKRSPIQSDEIFAQDTDNDHSIVIGDAEDAFRVNEIFEAAETPLVEIPGRRPKK